MAQGLKLTIELVPGPSWWGNLRGILPKSVWDKLRKKTYSEYGHRCGICGSEERLNCHEIWEYNDQNHVQKLAGFIALCNLCHHVKHIGLAGILANEGKLDYEFVVEHFMRVNGCSRGTFEEHKSSAFAQWRQRCQSQWKVDLGEFENLTAGGGAGGGVRGGGGGDAGAASGCRSGSSDPDAGS